MTRKLNQVSLEPYGFAPVKRPATKPIRVKTDSGKTLYLQGVRQEDAQPIPDMPQKTKGGNSAGCLAFGIILAIICLVLAVAFRNVGPKDPSYSTSDYDAGMACTMAEKLIKPQLKAPSTAQFDYGNCRDGATHSGNTWHLTSYVDADNSFGAHIRSYYTVDMTNVPPSDNWQMSNLIFLAN
jgi:hypothetical protein